MIVLQPESNKNQNSGKENSMKKEKIKTVDGQTLLDMQLPQIRFVADGLLPQGLHILAGAAKTGKSWLLLLLSLRVAQGKPFWNLQTERGTVLSLCLEDSLNRIQQRLMDLTEGAPDNLHFATLSKSLSDGLCGQIEGFITEHPDTNLVIIDTLQKVRENSGESNLYAADYKDVGLLKALADKYRIAVVVVQHLRKQFDSDPHNMVTGSTGLLGAADGSYVLKRENVGDKEAKLYIKGRDVEEQILNIRRDEETNEWIFVSSDTPVVNSLKSEAFFPLLMNYLTAEKKFCGTAGELSEKLSRAIAEMSEAQTLQIAKSMFRYAVEMELIMRMFSETLDFTPAELEEMRKEAIRNVRRTRGKVRLDDLFKRRDTQSL